MCKIKYESYVRNYVFFSRVIIYCCEEKKTKKNEKKRIMQPLSIEPVTSLDKCRVFLTKTD
jgi:hypothetical protein